MTAPGTRKTVVVTILVGTAKIQGQITLVDIVRHACAMSSTTGGDTILVGTAKIGIRITLVDTVQHFETRCGLTSTDEAGGRQHFDATETAYLGVV